MIQLIIATMCIALVVALALASIHYAGEAYARASLEAKAAAAPVQEERVLPSGDGKSSILEHFTLGWGTGKAR